MGERLTLERLDQIIDSPEYWRFAGMRDGGPNNRDEELIPTGRYYYNLGDTHDITLECIQTSGNNLDCLIHSFLMATCPAFRRRIRMNARSVNHACGANQFATYFRKTLGPGIIQTVYRDRAVRLEKERRHVIAQARENARKRGYNNIATVSFIQQRLEAGKSHRLAETLIAELNGSGGEGADLADDHLSVFVEYFKICVLFIRDGPSVIGNGERDDPTYMISNPRGGHFECVRVDGIGDYSIPYNTAEYIANQVLMDGGIQNFTRSRVVPPRVVNKPPKAPVRVPQSRTDNFISQSWIEQNAQPRKKLDDNLKKRKQETDDAAYAGLIQENDEVEEMKEASARERQKAFLKSLKGGSRKYRTRRKRRTLRAK